MNDKWYSFSIVEPDERCQCLIKDRYDRIFEARWNGYDFVLPIGFVISHEVVMWKFKD